jgi:hypothetical protein
MHRSGNSPAATEQLVKEFDRRRGHISQILPESC